MIAVDTGFFFALADQDDQWHQRALAFVQQESVDEWVTTWPVLAEATHLLRTRLGGVFDLELMADVAAGNLHVWGPAPEQLVDLPVLMRKYRNLPMDLADASLVMLAEHLGHGRILTTDQRDFGTYRWKNRKPFHNVLAQTA
jgi:predicted nucleic acid-binding protein